MIRRPLTFRAVMLANASIHLAAGGRAAARTTPDAGVRQHDVVVFGLGA